MSAPSRGAGPAAHGRRQHSKSSAAQTQSSRREKAKSSQSYVNPALAESGSDPPSGVSTARPGLKGRAYSAPIGPKLGPNGGDIPEKVPGSEGGDGGEAAGHVFYHRYTAARAERAAKAAGHSPASSRDDSSGTEAPASPTSPKSASRSPNMPLSPTSSMQVGESTAMPEINIGVLGARGVGKSTFIQKILDLKLPSPNAMSARKLAIDGNLYMVRLVELPFDDVDVENGDRISWPDTISDLAMPRIDGAYVLYDVTNKESLTMVPETLNATNKLSIPLALVSWKCDTHPAHRQVDPVVVEHKAKAFMGEINAFQSSEVMNEIQRQCLSVMLRAILAARSELPRSTTRKRANTSASAGQQPQQPWATKKHERAASEYSVSSSSKMRVNPPGTFDKAKRKSHRTSAQQTFLNLEESPGYESSDTDGPGSDVETRSTVSEMPSDEKGHTFDQLVNRLLVQPVSKNDTKFCAIFLALYRNFATPGQLLDAIVKRFQALDKNKALPIIRVISQLRYLAVLQQWVSCYPGDFAHPSTRRRMRRFVTRLATNRIFAVAAQEMIIDLEAVVEDDDTDWACCDRAREGSDFGGKSYQTVLDEDSGDEDYSKLLSGLTVSSGSQILYPLTPGSESLSLAPSSNYSMHTMMNNIEHSQSQARLLVPIPRIALGKPQWHQLMQADEEVIAKEITRIDWIMFSSIRPRDLVRHVTLSPDQKRLCKSLENVNRMTEHFNHVAFWVSNYILLRDKAKHRALMLEKMMKIARKVRELNNYNGLGAILAGINGTAVHRLAATRELVSPPAGRDFMKLEILMSSQKSYFSYRLAWENSSGERIPYIPLHRRDLVSAAEGNATFVSEPGSATPSSASALAPPGEPEPGADALLSAHPGTAVFVGGGGGRSGGREAPPEGVGLKERINWRKFEIMGDVIVGVQRAQGTPYGKMKRNDEVKKLILDVQFMKDDDDLYERSLHVEASASGDRRRFNWFNR